MPDRPDEYGSRQPGGRRSGESKVRFALHEPVVITGAQIVTNLISAFAGFLAIAGGLPYLLNGTVGPIFAVLIGSTLMIGGLIGTIAVLNGHWWMERIGLLVLGLGWVLILPAATAFALNPIGTPIRWLIVALILTAVGDVFKRYRRIDWAYLDPTR